MQNPSVSIVVPVCDSAPILEHLAELAHTAMSANGALFELLFVDDASEDGSWEMIERLHRSDGRIRGIALDQRSGQHAALLCGLRAASNEVVVTIDDDLEHPPEEIAKLLTLITQGSDLAYGTPLHRTGAPWRSAGALFARLLLARKVGLRAALCSSPFRAFRTSLRDAIPADVGRGLCLDLFLVRAAGRVSSVKVRHAKSGLPKSRYGFWRLVNVAISAGGRRSVGYSSAPYTVRETLPKTSSDG